PKTAVVTGSGPHPLLIATTAGEVKRSLTVVTKKKVIAFLAGDVLIPCNISGYGTPDLDTTKTAVEWYQKTAEDVTERVLFSLISEEQTAHRNGTRMNVDDLRKGNATLFLPEIRHNEGGTYRCVVIVTPTQAEATTTVEIIAQPVVTLSPKEVTIQKGQETTLTCAVKKFYPGSIDIYWEKNSEHTQHQHVSAADICTESSVQNSDGTFNVTSKVRHQSSSENERLIYSCIIKHKSFTTPSVLNATVTVTACADFLLKIRLCFAALRCYSVLKTSPLLCISKGPK
uniref:Ig-like domain-containing protein n=1 Tax=Salvator merianae TaxID=96440 RepID=A0A8D0C825_SALMN